MAGRTTEMIVLVSLALGGACIDEGGDVNLGADESAIFVEELLDWMPNNVPIPNANGFAASAHVAGYVDLDNAFFTPQGTNGRHCGTCHAPEDGWSINGTTVTALFVLTDGTHPIFVNNRDTDTPTCDMSTTLSRWNCTTMLRQGKFTRSINVPNAATREYDLIAVSDPFGVSTLERMWFFRRVMPSANFNTAVVNWDNSNGGVDMRDGLERQARGNITGAQQGVVVESAVQEIVDYEMGLAHAQIYVWGAGSTTAEGAKGGPVHALAALGQPPVAGRFDLFDAWQNSSNPYRRQIYRGQELFNNTNAASGRRCGACHNAANIGTNVNNAMFDIGISDVRWAKPDMAVFTLQSRLDGSIIQSTDLGRAARTGLMADLNRFDTPNLRGLSARAPYFHNGTIDTLEGVIDFYKESLGFDFTDEEEADLVAFLKAL